MAKLEAQRLSDEKGLDFSELFSHQYVLSRTEAKHDVAEWISEMSLCGWTLAHCPHLPCAKICDSEGVVVGYLLGIAIGRNNSVLSKTGLKLQRPVDAPDFWETTEQEISELAGKYIAIILTEAEKRVYFDPVMDMPAVYNQKAGIVAASPFLALEREVRINPKIDYRIILSEGGNYGMQQTCDPDILRGMSNHYLDLEDFTLNRHWPPEEVSFDQSSMSAKDVAEFVAGRLGELIRTLLENYACAMPVSGGNDSRTMIYSARDSMHAVRNFYSHRINWITRIDCYLAEKIVSDLNLDRRLEIHDASDAIEQGLVSDAALEELRLKFLYRTGYQHPPSHSEMFASTMVPDVDLVLRGNILDMTRANQWQRDTFDFDIDHGLSKLAIGGQNPEKGMDTWRDSYAVWMKSLPESATSRIYEFAFVELLLPQTLGARLLGFGSPNYLNPFNDRSLISACMSVNPKFRKQGRFNKTLHSVVGAPALPKSAKLRRDKELQAEIDAFLKEPR